MFSKNNGGMDPRGLRVRLLHTCNYMKLNVRTSLATQSYSHVRVLKAERSSCSIEMSLLARTLGTRTRISEGHRFNQMHAQYSQGVDALTHAGMAERPVLEQSYRPALHEHVQLPSHTPESIDALSS